MEPYHIMLLVINTLGADAHTCTLTSWTLYIEVYGTKAARPINVSVTLYLMKNYLRCKKVWPSKV